MTPDAPADLFPRKANNQADVIREAIELLRGELTSIRIRRRRNKKPTAIQIENCIIDLEAMLLVAISETPKKDAHQ